MATETSTTIGDLRLRRRLRAWEDRFEHWTDNQPDAGCGASDDVAASQRSWSLASPLGRLVLTWSRTSCGVTNERGSARARRDMLDHWGVVVSGGRLRLLVDGTEREAAPDEPQLLRLNQPVTIRREAAEWVMLFIPRDALADIAGALDSRAGRGLEGGLGAVLATHLKALPAALDAIEDHEAGTVAEATLAMLRAAVTGAGDGVPTPRAPLAATLRARLLSLIHREMGSVRLCPARLANLAGLSRTRLYEVFEPEGGVARIIQCERLRAVASTLADPAERRSIAAIAEAAGMTDPSVFSRAFRREFGTTPRGFRETAQLGLAPMRGGGELSRLFHGKD